MKKTLSNLLKIKSIVTIVVIALFAYCTITGALSNDNVMIIVSMVLTYYFTKNNKGGDGDGGIND